MISQVHVGLTCTFARCFYVDCSLSSRMGLAIFVFKKCCGKFKKYLYKYIILFFFFENKYH